MTPSQKHNELAPELFKRIIRETSSEAEAMVVLESIILGVMKFYRPNPRQAGEYLDAMTQAVLERM